MPAQTANKTTIEERAAATLKRLEEKDPGLKQLLKKAYGYAVFPSVGKASLVLGGSYGHGAVYERGKFIGHATISQFTAGVQIGGDTFTEVLVFQNQAALERLRHGKMAFAANASAVLVKAGAAAAKGFSNGVAAYAYASGGMLLEIAIGGQKFTFKPAGEEDEQQGKSGGRKGAAGKGKGASASGQDEDQEENDEGQDDEESGLLGRAMGGVRSALGGAAEGVKSAASRVSETAKAHPIATTVVATTAVTGAAILIVRAMRSGASADQDQAAGDDQSGYEDQSEDDGNQPQDQAEEGGEAQDQQDQGDEEGGQEDEEQNERGDTLNQLRNRRRRSRA